uniref:Uncharacterized protein n=1 Tax=Rhizophora mucronata TaxID=61149 RepID=A0A2P2NB95_RHIMU
MRKANRRTFPA